MNQCDGCRRGLPVDKNGHHHGPGGFWAGDVMVCTRDLYEDKDEVTPALGSARSEYL